MNAALHCTSSQLHALTFVPFRRVLQEELAEDVLHSPDLLGTSPGVDLHKPLRCVHADLLLLRPKLVRSGDRGRGRGSPASGGSVRDGRRETLRQSRLHLLHHLDACGIRDVHDLEQCVLVFIVKYAVDEFGEPLGVGLEDCFEDLVATV